MGHMPPPFFLIFYEYFSFSLTWDPIGAKTSKGYSPVKSLLNPFQLFLKFSSQWSSQKYCFGFLSYFFIFQECLALLGYVSRAHETEIRPQP